MTITQALDLDQPSRTLVRFAVAAALLAYAAAKSSDVPNDAALQAAAAAALAACPAAKPSDVAVTVNVYETEDNS